MHRCHETPTCRMNVTGLKAAASAGATVMPPIITRFISRRPTPRCQLHQLGDMEREGACAMRRRVLNSNAISVTLGARR